MTWSFIDGTDERYFMGLDMSKLHIDEFYITLNNSLTSNDTYLYTRHKDCVEVGDYLSHF